jgi:hypothetical protein
LDGHLSLQEIFRNYGNKPGQEGGPSERNSLFQALPAEAQAGLLCFALAHLHAEIHAQPSGTGLRLQHA